MRILSALLLLCSSAGVVLAQAVPTLRQAGPQRLPAGIPAKPSAFEEAVSDCEHMWDRGTHMSRKEWSQTCRRVQARLQNLKIE